MLPWTTTLFGQVTPPPEMMLAGVVDEDVVADTLPDRFTAPWE